MYALNIPDLGNEFQLQIYRLLITIIYKINLTLSKKSPEKTPCKIKILLDTSNYCDKINLFAISGSGKWYRSWATG